MWDYESGECVRTLLGHAGRLARIGFHPTGRYLGTASFDHTWRLWDVETGQELLLQASVCVCDLIGGKSNSGRMLTCDWLATTVFLWI